MLRAATPDRQREAALLAAAAFPAQPLAARHQAAVAGSSLARVAHPRAQSLLGALAAPRAGVKVVEDEKK